MRTINFAMTITKVGFNVTNGTGGNITIGIYGPTGATGAVLLSGFFLANTVSGYNINNLSSTLSVTAGSTIYIVVSADTISQYSAFNTISVHAMCWRNQAGVTDGSAPPSTITLTPLAGRTGNTQRFCIDFI